MVVEAYARPSISAIRGSETGVVFLGYNLLCVAHFAKIFAPAANCEWLALKIDSGRGKSLADETGESILGLISFLAFWTAR